MTDTKPTAPWHHGPQCDYTTTLYGSNGDPVASFALEHFDEYAAEEFLSALDAVCVRHNAEVARARDLARKLRELEPQHPWTVDECDALAELCEALGVDDD